MSRYLTLEDFRFNKPRFFCIRDLRREIVDGRPRLVVYFEDEEKGLPLTRQLAAEFTAELGPNPAVEEFFRGEGNLQ